METWAIVLIIIFSNLIIAASTFFTTRIQVRHSDKRFNKELERTREVESRERRREVRSEPLLKLRSELARAASKHEWLAAAAYMQHTRRGITEEQAQEILKEVSDDYNSYMRSGELFTTLFMVDDMELIKKVDEIRNEYTKSYSISLDFKDHTSVEIGEALKVLETNRQRIVDIQALINKRLEEL